MTIKVSIGSFLNHTEGSILGVCRFGDIDREDDASAGFRVSSISRFDDLRTSPSRSSLIVP